MSKHRWTAEEDNFLCQAAQEYDTSAQVMEAFNHKFGTDVTLYAIQTRMWSVLKIKMTNTRFRPFSDVEKAFLAENASTMTAKELQDGLYALTGRKAHHISISRYVNETLNVRHGALNKIPVGAESERGDYTYVKIADTPDGGGKNWALKQRVEWEKQHNTTLDDDKVVIFLNSNRRDFSEENLMAIPKKWIPLMSKNRWWSTEPNLTLAALKWCELHYAIRDVK